jgi:hypothetical protein
MMKKNYFYPYVNLKCFLRLYFNEREVKIALIEKKLIFQIFFNVFLPYFSPGFLAKIYLIVMPFLCG